MAGVTVGDVASITRAGLGADVKLEITRSDVTPVPVDSRVTLRMRTPLSENYIEITPGSSRRSLPSGGTLPATQTDPYVDVDQILSTLQGQTQQRTRQLIQGLGGALDGRGAQLNSLLGASSGTVTNGSRLMEILAGERASVSRLVEQLGNVAAAVGERDASITQIGQQGLVALHAVASRDQALRSMLVALPPTLRQVRTTTATLNSVSQVTTPVVNNLTQAVRELQPAIVDLHPVASVGRSVLSELGAAAPGLTTTLQELTGLGDPAAAAVPQVTKTLCQINPTIRYAKPYTDDIVQTIVGLGSASNDYDAIGHTIRLAPTLNDGSLAGAPPAVDQSAYTLLHTGLMGGTVGSVTWDPYPPPGMVGRSTSVNLPTVTGPSQLPSTGYQYPHIMADC
jgi:ABC-type transporter Mla subunit MlaD